MIKDIHISEVPKKTMTMDPKRFILWMFMVSIVMVFAALTSAYIVRQAEGNWLTFELPSLLWYASVILVLSSVTAQLAYRAAKQDNITSVKALLSLTVILGTAFLIAQIYTWGALVGESVFFVGNPAGSFIYVIMGVHGFHLISGLLYLLIMLARAFQYNVHSKKLLHLGLSVSYWHFLDGLWLYLFVFLLLNH